MSSAIDALTQRSNSETITHSLDRDKTAGCFEAEKSRRWNRPGMVIWVIKTSSLGLLVVLLDDHLGARARARICCIILR